MRKSALVLGLFFFVPAVYGGPASRGNIQPDLRPLVSYFQTKVPKNQKVIAIGEQHGQRELIDIYPQVLKALRQSGSNLNCLYFELESAVQPSIEAFANGNLPAEDVMFRGISAMFEKWGLVGENGFFNWQDSIAATIKNLNIGSSLLIAAKNNGFKVIAVDEQSRKDFVGTVQQSMLSQGKDEEAVREVFKTAELTHDLPESSFIYFRDEIVLRRSRKMAEKIAQTISSGQCTGGVFVAGGLHLQKVVSGGKRIYKNGGLTAVEVLRQAGIPTHLISTLVTGADSIRFDHARDLPSSALAYFMLGPHNFEHEWTSEANATLLVRQYPKQPMASPMTAVAQVASNK